MKLNNVRDLFIYVYGGNYHEHSQQYFWTPFVIVFEYNMKNGASIFAKDMQTLFGNESNNGEIKKICYEIVEKCLRRNI